MSCEGCLPYWFGLILMSGGWSFSARAKRTHKGAWPYFTLQKRMTATNQALALPAQSLLLTSTKIMVEGKREKKTIVIFKVHCIH